MSVRVLVCGQMLDVEYTVELPDAGPVADGDGDVLGAGTPGPGPPSPRP
jgi:hypothetical protein